MTTELPISLGDGYRLIQQLEGAGLGRVFVASVRDQAIVAVKVFDMHENDEQTQAQWDHECDALVAVRHTGLSGTIDHGVEAETGRRYLVQELVTGISLSKLRRMLRRPLEPVEAATFLLPIANALVYCHSRGVTHGRLTADHILIVEGAETRTRLVGLRPHGPQFFPHVDGPDWQASTEDPEHADVLGLAAVAHFLTFGLGGEGPGLHPHDLDALSFHGEDPTWDLILAQVLGNPAEALSIVSLRDSLLKVVSDNDAQRQATHQLGVRIVQSNASPPELAASLHEVAELIRPIPSILTIPHQIYRQHDGPVRMLLICGLAVLGIVGFAVAAGGLGPG